MISPSNYVLIIIGLVYPCFSRSLEWSSKWEVYPSIPAISQQGRPSFSETRCTGVDFWWININHMGLDGAFPSFFWTQKPVIDPGCLKRYESNFAAPSPQPLRAWSFLTQFLRHPLFANGLRRVEWSRTIHWHGIHIVTWRWHGGCPASRNKLWATGSLRCSCARDREKKHRPWPSWNCCNGIPSREYREPTKELGVSIFPIKLGDKGQHI
jgi:hypothetical protein